MGEYKLSHNFVYDREDIKEILKEKIAKRLDVDSKKIICDVRFNVYEQLLNGVASLLLHDITVTVVEKEEKWTTKSF